MHTEIAALKEDIRALRLELQEFRTEIFRWVILPFFVSQIIIFVLIVLLQK